MSRLATPGPGFAAIVEKFVPRLIEKLEAMDACWELRDFRELAALAHWLKGSAGTVGFDEFREPAAALEQLAVEQKESEIEAALGEVRELAERIETPSAGVVSHTQGADTSRGMASLPTTEAPAGSGAPLVSRLASRGAKMQAIIERFVPRLHAQLDAMEASWQARDFEELAKLAHWLKGSAGTVGFDEFGEPAKELEQLAKSKDGDEIEGMIRRLRAMAGRIVSAEE